MHNPSRLKIRIYDVTGRETFALVPRIMSVGDHVIPIPAAGLTSGIYCYVVDIGGDRIVCPWCLSNSQNDFRKNPLIHSRLI